MLHYKNLNPNTTIKFHWEAVLFRAEAKPEIPGERKTKR